MHKRIWSALVMALMAIALVVHPVLAAAPVDSAAPNEKTFGLNCDDGVCRAQLDLGIGANLLPQGAWLSVMQSALSALPDDLGVSVLDDVTITLPTGNLSLADADIVLTLDDEGKIATIRGSAMAPVPTFGLLGDWQIVTPARVEIGYDRGDALTELNAPLQADQRYFFFNAEAGIQLLSEQMALSSLPGHSATVIVDITQPLLFVDGQVTLQTEGQLAFIREALGPLADSGWLPTDLPLNQHVLVHLQGQVGAGVEPKLTVAGEYRMDGGLVGKWLQLDATPLLAQGAATIGPAGLVLEGSARSALQPEQWLATGAEAQLFVPFDAPETTSLKVGAGISSPAIGVEHEANATMAGEEGWWQRTGSAAWNGVQSGWSHVGAAAEGSYQWMSDGVGSGWAYTQEQWCAWTSRCEVAQSSSEVSVAVAER